MSLHTEHLEKEEGCELCEAKLSEDLQGKTLEVTIIDEPGAHLQEWQKSPPCCICAVDAGHQFMGRFLCVDCYDLMRDELFRILEARVGERKGP